MIRRSTLTLAWLGWLVFVVYGSLVPLDYVALPLDHALAAFRNIPFLSLGLDSRADWVANGVLYAPLGSLAEGVGAKASLSDDNQTILITRDGNTYQTEVPSR